MYCILKETYIRSRYTTQTLIKNISELSPMCLDPLIIKAKCYLSEIILLFQQIPFNVYLNWKWGNSFTDTLHFEIPSTALQSLEKSPEGNWSTIECKAKLLQE